MEPGDYINGRFVGAVGQELVSKNPAQSESVVFRTRWDPGHVDLACDAAQQASVSWMRMPPSERLVYLDRFRNALADRKDVLAEAIVQETGKLRSEANTEVQALLGRFALVANQVKADLKDGPVPGKPNEQLRNRPLGVVGIIGPFNFPLHLCHAHIIPSLLTGNTVVVKPSEVAPLCGQRYAEAAHAAGLPEGVFNLVQGRAATGAQLVSHPNVRGLCFTGSYPVGRKILEAGLDRPELLIALEMGGKNTVIVLEDADLRQAAHEVVIGGYLTTGQRCTGTNRVLVQRRVADEFAAILTTLVSSLRFGDPNDASSFAGPLATAQGAEHFWSAIETARAAGAQPLVEGGRRENSCFVDPCLHLLPTQVRSIAGYSDVEVFGPDVAVEVFDEDEEAIALINASDYGFANSVFTASDRRFEHIYETTAVGILNRNRSTNLASPRLPFGRRRQKRKLSSRRRLRGAQCHSPDGNSRQCPRSLQAP